jgi:hypothetical protein
MTLPRHSYVLLCAFIAFLGIQSVATSAQTLSATSLSEKLLAQTKVQQESQGTATNTHRYSFLFPTKDTAEITLTMLPNQFYKPTPQESKASGAGAKIYGLKTTKDSKSNSYTINFFVPYSSLPPNVVQQLRAMAQGPAVLRAWTHAPRLLPAAYRSTGAGVEPAQMGAQESGSGTLGPPQLGPEPSGEGEEGVTFSQVLSVADTSIQALQSWMDQQGIEDPALENLGEGVSDASAVFEAAALNDTAASMITELNAWTYCADHTSVQNPVPLAGGTPGLYQSQADQTALSIKTDVAVQFLGIMDKLLVSSQVGPEANVLLSLVDPFAVMAKKLEELDAEELATLKHTLGTYCSGTWYGSFQVSGTEPMGTTYSETGTIHFSVSNGQASGTIEGTYNFAQVYPDIENCTGQVSYQGTLKGGVTAMQNFDATTLFTKTVSPSTFTLHGTYMNKTCEDVYQAVPVPRRTLVNVILVDGQPSVWDSSAGPGAYPAQLTQAGAHGHQTVTVHKLR